jgi:ferric-dicitrate binding protein FerR (iron transport regulator)
MNAITKDTVFVYLAGNATVLQKQQMQEWLQQEGNEELYCAWLEEWEMRHPQYIPDVNLACDRFSGYLQARDAPAVPEAAPEFAPVKNMTGSSRFSRRMKIAAAGFLLIGLLGFLFREPLLYRHYVTGNAQVRVVELPDHSLVTLNANTDLKVSRLFLLPGTRRAYLSGEAVFTIQHTADNKPFIVDLPGHLEIQVLGTEFNVYARNRSHQVFLNRGSIRLWSTDASFQPLLVRPGELVKVDSSRDIHVSPNQSYSQVSAWTDHVFVFDRTPLEQVARMLEEQFGNKIVITDTSLANRVISGSCKWNKEEDILTTLSLMMKFSVYQANDTIMLK